MEIFLIRKNVVFVLREDLSIESTLSDDRLDCEYCFISSLVTFANETFLAGCAGGIVIIWDLINNYRKIHTLEPTYGPDTLAVFGDRLVGTSKNDIHIHVWNSLDGKKLTEIANDNMYQKSIYRSVKFFRKDIIVVSDREQLFVFNITNGAMLEQIQANKKEISILALQ